MIRLRSFTPPTGPQNFEETTLSEHQDKARTTPPAIDAFGATVAGDRRRTRAERVHLGATPMTKPLRDYAYDVGAWLLKPLEWVIVRTSLVPTTPFLDPTIFSWVPRVEEGWRAIRAELDVLLEHQDDLPALHEITPDAGDISDDRTWQSFFFFGYGFRSEANCRRCPETARILSGIPGLTTAFFSILSPGKRIPPHRGLWRGVLRYHIALKVPEPADQAGITVAGETRHWDEGKSLVFDDTYEHSAWNFTAGTRVVIFADVMRPCHFPGSWINWLVIHGVARTPFVSDGKRRHQVWETRYGALHPIPDRRLPERPQPQ